MQVHDFSPWTLPNGLFWIVKVPDSAVQITDNTLTIHLVDVPEVDAITFPPPPQDVPGISPINLIPVKLSFDITYTKSGAPRRIRPTSRDRLSPFGWAGEMWDATNSGTFSVVYDDGSFQASGSFSSSGPSGTDRNFGEMGTERNGLFLDHEGDDVQVGSQAGMSRRNANSNAKPSPNTAWLKGQVPVKVTY